jgi:hypothetical protein
MNNKEFLSKQQCEALSEINYDGDYDYVYHATGELWERGKKEKKERFVPAPLKQQVLRWFRENYSFYVELGHGPRIDFYYTIYKDSISISENNDYSTYEEAESACIDKFIELVKQ